MKNKEKSGVTFYIVALIILVAIGFYFKYHKNEKAVIDENSSSGQNTQNEDKTSFSIEKKELNEKNFSGSYVVINGDSIIAKEAQSYISGFLKEFKNIADEDVPKMREQFGKDSPVASYNIDISANKVEGRSTTSIEIETYEYTGGANGNTTYKVITASKKTGEIIKLSDIIKKDKQADFIKLLKNKLKNWAPDGSNISVLFEEDVNNIKFSDLADWSIDGQNFNIYFDEYQIGPGALGSIKFPILLSDLKNILVEGH